MHKILFCLITLGFVYSANAQKGVIAKNPEVVTGKLIKITKPLRDFGPADKAIPDVKVRDENGIIGKDEAFEEGEDQPRYPSSRIFNEDPALQKLYPNNPHLSKAAYRAIGINFNGMPNQPLNPPDPTMCAGPNHIIQMINGSSGALLTVYSKTGGVVVAQKYLDAITGKGGLGDPIALYDQLSDRFVLTEFANKPETGSEGLIIAVSQTGDPAGSWYVYFFSTGTTFPDYPKFSIWTDAYYATTNDFANGSSYAGSSVYAFDKAKMIAGNATATMQKFTLGSASKNFSMSPVCLEGTALPPAGSGGLIAYMQDDTWTSSTTDVDSIGMFEFKVDFTNSANTRIIANSSLATAPFKSDICTATRGQCITQPGSSIKVEALHQKIMNQPIYRNFAGYEGIVISHVVDKGSNISGIRWYELRKTTGNWNIYQQSTYAPDNTNRWLPGICYDKYGNIALAYNTSSSAAGDYPGGRYTGRKECDPLNTMTYSEDVIIAGSAANASTRYGDYNQLVCDPDGVTFWFTCEYNAASTWSTRIASFTLDPCTPPVCGDPSGLGSSAITNTSATVSWAVVTSAISYDVDYKVTTSGTWINAATATASTSVNISGLTQGTTYNWRVRATCSGGSGNYMASQFTTNTPCSAPAGLTSSAITSNSATVNWTAVSGGVSYDVDYKITGSATWTNAVTATTLTTVNLSGLTASTSYDWQVRANCGAVGSSIYSSSQFTTIAAGCSDQLEPNNTLATAAPISVGVDYSAQIAVSGDNDYYSFNNTTSQKNIKVTLTTLPGDYDLKLYSPSNKLLRTSQNGGTTSETINYNTTSSVGTYKVYVYGYAGAFSSTKCYTLKVLLSAGNFSSTEPESNSLKLVRSALKLYPVPASTAVTISFDAFAKGSADIVIVNQLGQQVLYKKVLVSDGINFNTIDVSTFKSGVYTVKVNNGKEIQTKKMIISK